MLVFITNKIFFKKNYTFIKTQWSLASRKTYWNIFVVNPNRERKPPDKNGL